MNQSTQKTVLTLSDIDKMFDAAEIVKTESEVYVNENREEFYINAFLNLSDGSNGCEIWTNDDDDSAYDLNDEQYNHVIKKLEKFNEKNI